MIMEPGMNGLETSQMVLEINPKQKTIIVSGYSETDRVRKAQELGVGFYVRKPYILEKIGWLLGENWIKDNLRRRVFLPYSLCFQTTEDLSICNRRL